MTQEKLQPKAEETNNTGQLVMFLIVLVAAIAWGIMHPSAGLRVLAVLLGFGGIVMIHEFGHFIVAKLGGIKVEAFSIGFPPVVLGIRKLKTGWRVRVLPKIGEVPQLQEGDSETEYQVGLFPIGGFVKMLGQSDTGSAEACTDPRSFANRPVGIRMAVIAAGVIFNAIGAVIIFMLVFMSGIDQKPAVVGRVMDNSPAYDAGLQSGDRIVEVNGERFLNFEAVVMSPALSAPNEPISFMIRRGDEPEQKVQVIAEKRDGDASGVRSMGILPAQILTVDPQIAKSDELTKEIFELTGLRPGDEIKAINGQSVKAEWELRQAERQIFKPQTAVTVSRQWPADMPGTLVNVDFPVRVSATVENFRDELDVAHFSSMVPCLRVEHVELPVSLPGRISNWFMKTVLHKKPKENTDTLKKGDILIKIGDQDYPTYRQLRELATANEGKDLPVLALRKDKDGKPQTVEVTMKPKMDPASERVVLGLSLLLDMESPVMAQTLTNPGLGGEQLGIPSGATITAIDDKPVKSFFEIASLLQEKAGTRATVYYEKAGQTGQTALVIPEHEPVHAQSGLATGLPLSELVEEYRAANLAQAFQMGMKKAWQFVWQSYVTLGRLFQGNLGVKALSGPVGIITMTYHVAGASLGEYLYFLGLISSCLAVMNLLPLPVLDGGHIVILLIEKIIGRPINERVLAGAMYAGMALLLSLILFITYKDLIRVFYS